MINMEINERLDAALAARGEDMERTLAGLIKVPSVRGEAEENAPFGREVRRMLDTAMADIRRLGMTPRNIDGYACDTEIGEGEEVIAVLAHLDVVPEGEGWHSDPYGAEIRDGRMIGRGTSDDKGPAVAALYAMRAIQDAGIPLRKRCRLILGCDEETSMEDLEYYDKKLGLPDKGFSPDANFPLINTEKGIFNLVLRAPMTCEGIVSIESGTRSNVVPGEARAVLQGDLRAEVAEAFEPEDEECSIEACLVEGNTHVMVKGFSAHASKPHLGRNAAKMLLSTLCKLELGGEAVRILDEAAGKETAGQAMGIAGSDEVSGDLTLNLGILRCRDGKIEVEFNCRYPVFFNGELVMETIEKRLAPGGFVKVSGVNMPPHHVPANSEIVTRLMEVYNEINDTDEKPFAIGGGTYARHLKEGVAFGMIFPGEPELEHQPDESISLENFHRAARIYAYAILALCA